MQKLLIALTIFSLIACNRNTAYDGEQTAHEGAEIGMDNVDAARQKNKQEEATDITSQLKLIKTGNVTFETDDLRTTAQKINAAIQKNGGYASNESEHKSEDQLYRTISIRVPSTKFDALLSDISAGVSHFDNREITVADVTEEYVDATARLNTKKQIEARYIQLLSKAGKISDMLEVERQLGEIRTEIEQIEGRLHYLNNQVSLSTLTVNYYETFAISSSHKTGFFYKLKTSMVRGWDMVLSLILGLVSIWPLILIGTGALWAIRRYRSSKN
jgi:hypothetical protein